MNVCKCGKRPFQCGCIASNYDVRIFRTKECLWSARISSNLGVWYLRDYDYAYELLSALEGYI